MHSRQSGNCAAVQATKHLLFRVLHILYIDETRQLHELQTSITVEY